MRPELIRIIAAFGGAILIAALIGKPYLFALRRLGLGQHIRKEGPQSHQQKAGTPTMGGVIILTALAVILFALGAMRGPVAVAFLLTVGFGLLGLADDLLSVTRGRNMGLKARQKLLGQAILAAALAYYAVSHGFGQDLALPFTGVSITLGPVLFFLLIMVAGVSAANGVNLTDGLDGLATGTMAVASLAQAAMAWIQGQPEIALFAAAVAGSCLGFLWFNAHPAAVFMGDTGSLALGAALVSTATFSRTVVLLPIAGGIFVLETLAVILQVFFFQTMHKRVLRMAPLHHHFELGGLAEEKVVTRFCLASVFFGLLAVVALLAGPRG